MFSSASLKFKLISAFMTVTMFMVLVAGVGYWCLGKVQSEYGYIAEIVVDNLKTTGGMGDQLRDMHQELIQTQSADSVQDKTAFKGKWLKLVDDLNQSNKTYEAIPFAEGEQKIWDEYKKAWENYVIKGKAYFEVALLMTPESEQKAADFIKNDLGAAYGQVRVGLSGVWNFHEGIADSKGNNAKSVYNSANFWTITISLVGIVFALSIGIYFANLISSTITNFSSEISSSAGQTSIASNELTSASSQLSQGATESAASLEETVSSLEELSSMVKLNSDHAKEANSLSQKSLNSAESGEKEITKLIEAMSVMAKSSQKIEEIINVIDDIAFQTNLLALNAAVEAARAGEQGKGFAVVADAVRNLAQRSAAAAKDINVLIKENVERTEDGVSIADTSGSVLKEIVTSVKKVADLNSEISAASQEQANGIEQISKAMNHLDQAIQSNASSSEEVASSAEEMSSQSESLKELVGSLRKFVNGDSDVSTQSAPASEGYKPRVKTNFKPMKLSMKEKAASKVLPFDEKSDASIGKADGF